MRDDRLPPLHLEALAAEAARQEAACLPGAAGEQGAPGYRLWEDLTSPYSAKVRAYLHHKGIPYRRLRVTFRAYLETLPGLVGTSVIPVLLAPGGEVLQDSTPLLRWLEARHPEPAVLPADARLAFLDALLEDFADEYLVRLAMHFRWGTEEAAEAMSRRIARRFAWGEPEADLEALAPLVRARQAGMDAHLGLTTPGAREDLEAQGRELLALLEEHLRTWPFLLGGRPAACDFALHGMLWAHLYLDPVSARWMERHGPRACDFVERMAELGDVRGGVGRAPSGALLQLDAPGGLPPTVRRLLRLVARTWLPLGRATARASLAREKSLTVTLDGRPVAFSTNPYRAWAFEQVQRAWLGLTDAQRASLGPALEEAGLLPGLLEDGVLHNGLFDGLTPPVVVGGVADNRVRARRRRG
jgi:glutathione S-transferase